MGDVLKLKVLTPLGPVVDAEAREVVVPGVQGEFGVLPAHTPYVALVASGLLSFRADGRRELVAVKGGVVEVGDDRVVVLTTEALRPGDLDPAELEARERQARQRLEEALAVGDDPQPFLEEYSFYSGLRGALAAGSPAH